MSDEEKAGLTNMDSPIENPVGAKEIASSATHAASGRSSKMIEEASGASACKQSGYAPVDALGFTINEETGSSRHGGGYGEVDSQGFPVEWQAEKAIGARGAAVVDDAAAVSEVTLHQGSAAQAFASYNATQAAVDAAGAGAMFGVGGMLGADGAEGFDPSGLGEMLPS